MNAIRKMMLCTPLVFWSLTAHHLNAALMDYCDVPELGQRLQQLADNSRHAQRITIGQSIDYKTDPARPAVYPIYALRISASTDETVGDDYRKNSILFEAGTHALGWMYGSFPSRTLQAG
jgi:hypothetical protein